MGEKQACVMWDFMGCECVYFCGLHVCVCMCGCVCVCMCGYVGCVVVCVLHIWLMWIHKLHRAEGKQVDPSAPIACFEPEKER